MFMQVTISFVEIKYSAMVVCLLATFAAVQEGHLIKKKRVSVWSCAAGGPKDWSESGTAEHTTQNEVKGNAQIYFNFFLTLP